MAEWLIFITGISTVINAIAQPTLVHTVAIGTAKLLDSAFFMNKITIIYDRPLYIATSI